MSRVDFSSEYQAIVDTFQRSGGDPDILSSSDVSSLVVHGNQILSKNITAGIHADVHQMDDGVEIFLRVEENTRVDTPIHLCFGLVHKRGKQRIISHYTIGDNSSVSFLAHCSFPRAENVTHAMDAEITIGNNSRVHYNEVHFHGPEGGIEVIPRGVINLGKNSHYFSEFKLIEGAVGRFDLDYTAHVGDHSSAELYAKLFGKGRDSIRVKESIYLNGTCSRGITKTRIVNKDYSQSEVLGEVIGNGDFARGHVDCTEIIEGPHTQASAVPLVRVTNPRAKVTHEAAIGSVDKNQVETLTARGLTENEAIDIIVRGLLQ
ncbi:MAG: SufB/SufD family protein [Spirochaetota bacterium]